MNFRQGDIGKLPFENDTFDIVLSMNGFHAFPNKEAAYRETFRVLTPGDIFCGCFYIREENAKTDRFVSKSYVPKGFFTAPFETKQSLTDRLRSMYHEVEVTTVESKACFICKE